MKLYLIIGLMFSLGFNATRWQHEERSVAHQTLAIAAGTLIWPLVAGLLAGHVARTEVNVLTPQEPGGIPGGKAF